MVFVDTSALYALLYEGDANHAAARQAWRSLLDGEETLTTSNYILLETSALIQARHGLESVRRLIADVVPVVDTVWVSEETHNRAMGALFAANRRQLSLVDCTSFELMRGNSVTEVFTFDDHFGEQGFQMRPG